MKGFWESLEEQPELLSLAEFSGMPVCLCDHLVC